MTIDELIRDLSRYPGHLEVLTEGCDCVGESARVVPAKEYGYKNSVIIERPKNEEDDV